jgi:hypothetical protein
MHSGHRIPLALLAFFASACSSDPEQPIVVEQQGTCEGRGEPIVVGMSEASDTGTIRAELLSATPLPPETGDNDWTLELRTEDGEEVTGASLVVHSVMVDHTHPSPVQVGVEMEPGFYEVSPISITMPGYWELRLTVMSGDGDDVTEAEITFPVCVKH